MEAESLFYLRPYKKSDLNFIQHSWASSYYKGAEYNHDMSPKEFNDIHRPIRDELLQSPNVTVIIASSKQDEDLILGWMLIEKLNTALILHYLYIKQAFKSEGVLEIFLSKLPKTEVLVSHMTDRAAKIIGKKHKLFDNYRYSHNTIMLRDKFSKVLQAAGGDDDA